MIALLMLSCFFMHVVEPIANGWEALSDTVEEGRPDPPVAGAQAEPGSDTPACGCEALPELPPDPRPEWWIDVPDTLRRPLEANDPWDDGPGGPTILYASLPFSTALDQASHRGHWDGVLSDQGDARYCSITQSVCR